MAEVADAISTVSSRSSTVRTLSMDLARYGGATAAYLILSSVVTFVAPRFFTVQAFGTYRLFLLYASFSGLLHFGILDGALVRWAKQPEIVLPELSITARAVALASGLVVLSAVTLYAFNAGTNGVAFAFALGLIAVVSNISTTFQFALQAHRRFDILSALNVISPLLLLCGISAIALAGRRDAVSLIGVYVAVGFAVSYVSFRSAGESTLVAFRPRAQILDLVRTNCAIGIFILLANFASNLLLGLDRLLVSFVFPIERFAVYSFAASVLYGVNALVLSAGRVFFPHLCRYEGDLTRFSRLATNAIVLVWCVALTFYFVLAWLVRLVLPQYLESIPLIRILLLATGPAALVQIIHFARLRAEGKERRLLVGASTGLFVSVIALAVARMFGTLTAIAWAAVASQASWWIANECLLAPGVFNRGTLRTGLMLAFAGSVFFFCSSRSSLPGALTYMSVLPIVILSYLWLGSSSLHHGLESTNDSEEHL